MSDPYGLPRELAAAIALILTGALMVLYRRVRGRW